MNRSHTPTAAFRTALENEVVREFRRGTPPTALTRPPHVRLRSAAIVAAALALGALAGAVPAQVQDARTRSELMASAQAEERLARIRYDVARAAFDEARRAFDAGAVGRESLAEAEAELRAMEYALQRNRLNQEEIRATSAPPRDEISAPRVGERDFVSERLQLDLAAAQRRLVSRERTAAEAERRHRIGAVTRGPLLDAQDDVARAQSELQSIGMRLTLRQEFLGGDIAIADIESRLRRSELMLAADLARTMHSHAVERLASLRQLHAVGQAQQLEVMRAELEMLKRTQELEFIGRRLEALNALPAGR